MKKSIMIQGTMSNAGKSFITAGLCRVFRQDGYRTAPFKSQNMALNSYITEDGLEIGRAQAMQAEAAGILPTAEMNPILLKPTSSVGSQVIVNGEVRGNMAAADYFRQKKTLIPDIMRAYRRLEENYDIIVIEGAGSPAEINLRENDIVNMGLAKMTKSPVLLAGDIDRGGVFASLYGTVKLLEGEASFIKGLIINKFRGDVKILEPGLKMIEEKTGIPVVGVIPVRDIDIDDEDSLSERLKVTKAGNGLDVAVIRLPHISNFTDFNSFGRMDGISLRYVSVPGQLKNPDFIILPGTKNTMKDMEWLRESGLEALILRQAEKNTPIMGICGGFQILGKELKDPEGVEHGGNMRGMGLLDAITVFEPAKVRTRIGGKVISNAGFLEDVEGLAVTGYEIHMGKTYGEGNIRPFIQLEDGRTDGFCNFPGNVFGTYLHGIFDSEGFLEGIFKRQMKEKGIETGGTVPDLRAYREEQYDKLAALIRESLNMEEIYRILERGAE